MSKHAVIRYHDFCAGHRVVGHESKCRHLHGHNYRVHFHVRMKEHDPSCEGSCINTNPLDSVGRVIDFSVVKEKLCNWLEKHWDHKFLHWDTDPIIETISSCINGYEAEVNCGTHKETCNHEDVDKDPFWESLVALPFNPTAENMAQYLVDVIGPAQLADTDVELYGVVIEETRKCSVSYFK